MGRSEKRQIGWLHPLLLVLVVFLFFGRALFTDQIIRASDVITQFFWSAKDVSQQGVGDYLVGIPRIFQAQWEPLNDGGRTLEGGWNAIGLLFHRYLIQHFLPFPASIAWLAVLALAWGGLGTYCYCRRVGLSRFASFVAGLLFALCTENASLLNAGHIQKMEAIGWMPWSLYFLERGIRERRLFPYAMTALVLAVQFFHMHWQISFYTCLAVGGYWLFMMAGEWRRQGRAVLPSLGRQTLLATVMTLLFFSTIAMSFAPLLSWSQQSERGGGMSYSEGMSWSMPPEEVLTYAVPGLFGLSRQEEGDRPAADEVFYWGRMHFSQTSDYLGLLPWIFLPLPLLFRRDRYAVFFGLLMAVTLLMAMGKYTVFYDLLFRYIPGFSTFRVPKMILYLFAFGASVLMGQGIDLVRSGQLDERRRGWWLAGITLAAVLLAAAGAFLQYGRGTVFDWVGGMIAAPTPFQSGPELVATRYLNMLRETIIAASLLLIYLGILFLGRRGRPGGLVWMLLLGLFIGDLWRVNGRFLVLTAPPVADRKSAKNDVVAYLEPRIGNYRLQPLDSQAAFYYADYGMPNISAYVTVSEKRYREFLEHFSYLNGMVDMMNLRYLLMAEADYAERQGVLAPKYEPVLRSSAGTVVLENRQALPKAWLVPAVTVMANAAERLAFMAESPLFRPAVMAVVESAPPLSMGEAGENAAVGLASVEQYEPNRIVVRATPERNVLLVLGEKYYRWWRATVDGRPVTIHPVNHVLRGVYLPSGNHRVEFVFDPLPFRIGTWVTLCSLLLLAGIALREWRRKGRAGEP